MVCAATPGWAQTVIDLCARPEAGAPPHVSAWIDARARNYGLMGEEIRILALGTYYADEVPVATRAELDASLNQDGYLGRFSLGQYLRIISEGRVNVRFIVPEFVQLDRTTADAVPFAFPSRWTLEDFTSIPFDRSQLSIDPETGHYYLAMVLQVSDNLLRGPAAAFELHPSTPEQTPAGCRARTGTPCFDGTLYNFFRSGRPVQFVDFHEVGHAFFNWEEFRRVPGSRPNSGIGQFGPMAFGQAPYNPFLRMTQGWGRTIEISDLAEGTRITLPKNKQVAVRFRTAAKPDEYFLVEAVRRETLFYPNPPDEGLWIWHVDGAQVFEGTTRPAQFGSLSPERHNHVSVEQADGEFALETKLGDSGGPGDAFNSGDAFGAETEPSSRWWDDRRSGLSIAQIEDHGASMSFVLGDVGTTVTREASAIDCGTRLVTRSAACGLGPELASVLTLLLGARRMLARREGPEVEARVTTDTAA